MGVVQPLSTQSQMAFIIAYRSLIPESWFGVIHRLSQEPPLHGCKSVASGSSNAPSFYRFLKNNASALLTLPMKKDQSCALGNCLVREWLCSLTAQQRQERQATLA